MTEDDPVYTFPPRRTNGILGKVSATQGVAVVTAIGLPWVGIRTGSPAAFAALSAAGIALAVTAFLRVNGRYLTEWLRPVAAALVSRATGAHTYRGAVFAPDSLRAGMDLPGDLAGLRMLSTPSPDGQARIGICVDDHARTATAVLLTEGTPIVLEETSEQLGRLAAWESVMESTTDPDAAIARWQLLFRSTPDATNTAQDYYLDHAVHRDAPPARALRELVSHAAPTAQRHEVFFAVAFDLTRLHGEVKASGGNDDAVGVVVVERLAELQRQITEASIPVRGWLSASHFAAVLHTQFDPDSLPLHDPRGAGGYDPRAAGPSACERSMRCYHHDSAVSSTVWVQEMPQRPVRSNWLAPLLQQSDVHRCISLVAEPLSPDRAARSVRNQRLAAKSSLDVKARHGLVVDARTTREHDAAEQLDDELAAGAGYFRFHMFVTVTAADTERLRVALTSVRRRLTRVRCTSMVLYGEQDQGFFAGALPLARGLAPMRGMTGS